MVGPMKKLALAALVLGSIACSKTDQTASSATKDPATPAPAAAAAAPAPAPTAAPAPKVLQGAEPAARRHAAGPGQRRQPRRAVEHADQDAAGPADHARRLQGQGADGGQRRL